MNNKATLWLYELWLTFWIQHHCRAAVKYCCRGNIFKEVWHTERMYALIKQRHQLNNKKVNNYVKRLAK